MARGKKGRRLRTNVSNEPQASREAVSAVRAPEQRFQWWDYAIVGVFVVLFCQLQYHVAVWMVGAEQSGFTQSSIEETSLGFFFGTIWKGFLVVLLLVWLYDYFYNDAEEDTA